ncbi:MAG: hypothetical protein ABSE82_16335, partial [Nitrososphaerales archaeon]
MKTHIQTLDSGPGISCKKTLSLGLLVVLVLATVPALAQSAQAATECPGSRSASSGYSYFCINDNWVLYGLTPGGWVAKACIYNVGNGATVLTNDTILYANDTRAYTIQMCPYASLSAFQPAGSGSTSGSGIIPGYTGWIEQVADHDSNVLNDFSGDWTVPSSPTDTTDGQTIFLWIGLDASSTGDSADLIQPVLQWGPSAAGGGTHYSIDSWYIDFSSNTYYYGTLVSVSSTDTIEGAVSLDGCGHGLCVTTILTKDTTSGNYATLNADIYGLNYGYVVLEVANWTQCS